MAEHQALYRRYRSQRFDEVLGQEHVVRALRNAVRDDRVSHAYLFSGPRGTGKTSTARILAKALNCPNVTEGEPCGVCEVCRAIEHGTSFDVFELDAASNNGVDSIRELNERAALGTAGRRKVYILDEVHMLSKGASNALLKTLEDPPAHVVFVLATTDPQKVEKTISSRTQHLQFHLLPADVLAEHVEHIAKDASLDLPPGALEYVLRVGGGSARDTLSALDQVVAAGSVPDDGPSVEDLVDALADRDAARALSEVAEAVAAGTEVRGLTERLIAWLRDAFLVAMAPDVAELSEASRARAADQAARLGPAATVRALEVLGAALVEMRHATDPRVLLDVAIVRIANPALDDSPAALLERLERLERADRSGAPSMAAPSSAALPESPPVASSGARAALGTHGRKAAATPAPAEEVETPADAAPSTQAGPMPSRDELTIAWADIVLPQLKGMVKALFAAGRFVSADDNGAVFALPTAPHRQKCEEKRKDVEATLAAHYGRPIPLTLIVDGEANAPTASPAATAPAPDEDVDLEGLVDAPAAPTASIDRLTQAFPGAELLTDES
jgi:DNA polymerase III subunit gamma/tau